jgi:lipopolysaccharide biosynthesis protein
MQISIAQNTVSKDYSKIKLVAFYLTQFHPTLENDEWWGKGFTEWTNATKAKPQFKGHYQPHLPTEFGFYDLRVRQTRRDQIAVAKEFGIGAFCYHYFWFSGKRLLNAPLDDMLADPESDMPFCLNWANENWTRTWDGSAHKILIAQKYDSDDDLDFIKSVVPFMKDRRYLRLDDKPVLMVYRPQHLPNAKKSAEVWRKHCKAVGIGDIQIFCCFTYGNWEYKKFGFDGGVEFPPHSVKANNVRKELPPHENYSGYAFEFKDVAEQYLTHDYSKKNGFRGLYPSWDNTARKGNLATITLNGTPSNYEYWLSQALKKTAVEYPSQERLVFINAWNEWAEGCHLEPDRKYGRAFLEATLSAKMGNSNFKSWANSGLDCDGLSQSLRGRRRLRDFIPKYLKVG